uniref:LAGLIDADG endonuclease n=1 Tax=Scytalidium sp. TaxID=1715249 RepID=A0A513U0R8_9PEZI|nr:LAGLIDADG endonuclease [Scytalidium sp.]
MKTLFIKTTTTLARSINIACLSPFISPLGSIRFIRGPSKSDLQLTSELKEVVVGKMLGDLGSERPNLNCNTRLSFKHTDKQIEYIEHLYLLFKDYCKSSSISLSRYDNRPNRNKKYKAIKFNTRSLPCFNEFRELFYNNEGVKIIPNNLGDYLTPRALAYWFQDDGYKSVNGFYFSTESFTLEENRFLAELLLNKFGLECGVHTHTNGYRLYILSTSREKYIGLIKPYILPLFYYKL